MPFSAVAASPLSPEDDLQLADLIAECRDDPLRFVEDMWDWPIHGQAGPDLWQRDLLLEIGRQTAANNFNGVDPVSPLKVAVASGRGVGKSTLTAWIVLWILATRPYSRVTVTATTNDQLQARTWAAIREWKKTALCAHWFEDNAEILYRHGDRERWFAMPQSCAEEKYEAFQGQHAADATSAYIFDEASGVPDKIFHAALGALNRGEPMVFCFGNPTKTSGQFYRAVFGSERAQWTTRIVDVRDTAIYNHEQVEAMREEWGETSDLWRVYVLGQPPLSSDLQYIDSARIQAAQHRLATSLPDDPLIAGVDVSGGGSAQTVCWFRKGFDARALKPLRLTGDQSRDRLAIVSMLANALKEHDIQAMFIDAAFGAAVVERLKMLGYQQVIEVNFGAQATDPHYENLRAQMWGQLKTWLEHGAIPADDPHLAVDLSGPGYHLNKRNKLVLESKENMARRGVASPDRADALALTFALPVHPQVKRPTSRPAFPTSRESWLAY